MAIPSRFYWCCLTVALLCGLAKTSFAAQCDDDPTSAFSINLKKELHSLEYVLRKRFSEDAVTKFMNERKLQWCKQLSTNSIDMNGAIKESQLVRDRAFYCEQADSSGPSELVKSVLRENKLTKERLLLAIGRFCGRDWSTARFGEKDKYRQELQSEIFCIEAAEPLDTVPDFVAGLFKEFPPMARVLATGKALCERLKKGEITVEDARYQRNVASLKEREKLGNSELLRFLAFVTWAGGHNVSDEYPYYWGAMFLVGFVLWLIFFPLFLLGEHFGWESTETISTVVFSIFCTVAVVSLLYQLDLEDYTKIFGLLGTIVGIIGGVVAAAIGLKKLLGKAKAD